MHDLQGGTCDEGGATVNNTTGGTGGVASKCYRVNGDLPIFGFGERDPGDASLKFRIVWNDKVNK